MSQYKTSVVYRKYPAVFNQGIRILKFRLDAFFFVMNRLFLPDHVVLSREFEYLDYHFIL